MELPIELRQKFQIGDICKIVQKGKFAYRRFQHPPSELEDYKKDRECIILHTYPQVYWGENFDDYCVYLLPRNKNEYTGSLAWIEGNQLEFIRKPTSEEIEIVVQEDKRMLSYKNCPYKSIFHAKRIV